MSNLIELRISQLIRDLQDGKSRYRADDAGWGSIEEKYGMIPREVELVFTHPKLKDVKTTPMRFKLIDDVDNTQLNTVSLEDDLDPPAEPTVTQTRRNRRLLPGTPPEPVEVQTGGPRRNSHSYLDAL